MSNYTRRKVTSAKSGNIEALCVPWAENYIPYGYAPKKLKRNYALWVLVDGKERMHSGYSKYRTRKELKEETKGFPQFEEILSRIIEESEREENEIDRCP